MSLRNRSDSISTDNLKTKHHVQFYKAHSVKAIIELMSFHSMKGEMNGKGHGFNCITNLLFPHISQMCDCVMGRVRTSLFHYLYSAHPKSIPLFPYPLSHLILSQHHLLLGPLQYPPKESSSSQYHTQFAFHIC